MWVLPVSVGHFLLHTHTRCQSWPFLDFALSNSFTQCTYFTSIHRHRVYDISFIKTQLVSSIMICPCCWVWMKALWISTTGILHVHMIQRRQFISTSSSHNTSPRQQKLCTLFNNTPRFRVRVHICYLLMALLLCVLIIISIYISNRRPREMEAHDHWRSQPACYLDEDWLSYLFWVVLCR